jgi:hypothetical protein
MISRILFFNSYLRSTQKGYLNFGIAALIGLQSVMFSSLITSQVNFNDTLSLISTVLLAFYVIAMPIFTYYFLKHNQAKLK